MIKDTFVISSDDSGRKYITNGMTEQSKNHPSGYHQSEQDYCIAGRSVHLPQKSDGGDHTGDQN